MNYGLINKMIEDEAFSQAITFLEQAYAERPVMISFLIKKFELLAKTGHLQEAENALSEISQKKNDLRLIQTLKSYLDLQQTKDGTWAQARAGEEFLYSASSWNSLRSILGRQSTLRVVFVNDNGFLYGAGIAVKRQIKSFLLAGHAVGCVSWNEGANEQDDLHSFEAPGVWLGIKTLAGMSVFDVVSRLDMTMTIVEKVKEFKPNLIISGNFHAAGWPLDVLEHLHNEGIPVVTYIHDCDWVTGGCAHGGYYNCSRYLDECNDRYCPKPHDAYPPKTKGRIYRNWLQRQFVFSSQDPLPLATNSNWTYDIFRKTFGNSALIKVLHLGVDTDRFIPGGKVEARQALGVPLDAFVILAGSGFFAEPGKGSNFVLDVFDFYANIGDVFFVSFGHPSEKLKNPRLLQTGYISSEEQMVKLYQAADIFVNPVQVEAFGQTMLEASSCGCPIVCFPVCGVPDVAKDNMNAIHAGAFNAESLIAAIEEIRASKELQKKLAQGGRKLAVSEFSLAMQYRRWDDYLRELCELRFEQQSLLSWKRKECYSVPCEPFVCSQGKQMGGLRCKGREKQDFVDVPLVTIATIVYNDKIALEETIRSIISQDYPNLEWVIIDGGSTDGTLELIAQYEDCIDLWVSDSDKGIYDAMNKAAELANGRWINYMNAGDFFCGVDAVSRVLRHAPFDADVIYGHVYYRKMDGNQEIAKADDFEKKWNNLIAGDFFSEPWMAGLPPHQSTFMRASIIRELKFDLGIKVSADWDLIFRARNNGAKFHLTDTIVAVYRAGGFSAQHAVQWVVDVWGIAKKYTKNPEKASEYFSPIVEAHKRVHEA